MTIFSCVSWVRDLSVQLYQWISPNATVKREVPYQIIADILIRLPAECAYFCGDACPPLRAFTRTPSFASRQFRGSTPTIAFQNFYGKLDSRVQTIETRFLADHLGREILTRSTDLDFTLACPQEKKCVPFLYGSYHGFLMLKNLEFDNVLVLWNPLTKEKVSAIAPDGCHQPRGFFFHENEYKVLFMSTETTHFEFNLLSLRTKSSRMVSRFNHPPSGIRSPVILNGCLYWMICNESYKQVNGHHSSCSNSIVIFDMYTEEVRTMAHPGVFCEMKLKESEPNIHSDYMKLMENRGTLRFCNDLLCGTLVFWDLGNWGWSKRYVIDLQPSYMFCREQRSMSLCGHKRAEGVNIYNNFLLLRMSFRDLFICIPGSMEDYIYLIMTPKLGLPLTTVLHVDTLFSLDTDSTVFLGS